LKLRFIKVNANISNVAKARYSIGKIKRWHATSFGFEAVCAIIEIRKKVVVENTRWSIGNGGGVGFDVLGELAFEVVNANGVAIGILVGVEEKKRGCGVDVLG